MLQSYRPVFTDATRPDFNVERVGTLAYTHSIMLPEDVEASFEVGSPLVRVGALALDLGILFLVTLVLGFLLLGAGWQGSLIVRAIFSAAMMLLNLGYFFIFEGFFCGQTPGKRALKLRVIKLNGEEIGPREGIVRAFMRLLVIGPFPAMLVFGLFSYDLLMAMAPFLALGFLMFLNRRVRSIADIAAGTLVVLQTIPHGYGQPAYVPGYFELPQHYFPLKSNEMARLSPEDYVKLEDFSARLTQLQRNARQQACMTAAAALAQRMEYSRPVEPKWAERFLFEVHSALKEQLRQLYPDLYQ